VEQGSVQWLHARIGIPTASCFDKIITPKTGKLSASFDGYMHRLIAEQLLGQPLEDASGGFLDRGAVLEQRAVSYYELQREVDTEKVGFVLRDDRRAGASPDRFVGSDGLLEIKVPAAHTHVAYLLDADGIGYRAQVQGQLWVAEREWSDTLSYHPELPPALIRQARDEPFIKLLAAAVQQFNDAMDEAKAKLQKLGLFEDFERPMMRVVA
jgi:hypothetical protein